MFAAVGDISSAKSGGLAYYNLCTKELLNFVSLESTVPATSGSFFNDVAAVSSSLVLLTDSYANQVFSVVFEVVRWSRLTVNIISYFEGCGCAKSYEIYCNCVCCCAECLCVSKWN